MHISIVLNINIVLSTLVLHKGLNIYVHLVFFSSIVSYIVIILLNKMIEMLRDIIIPLSIA